MKYKLKINGMTCMSCGKLLEMLFEDKGFKNVQISTNEHHGEFDSELNEAEAKKFLDEIFSEAIKYSYSELQTI